MLHTDRCSVVKEQNRAKVGLHVASSAAVFIVGALAVSTVEAAWDPWGWGNWGWGQNTNTTPSTPYVNNVKPLPTLPYQTQSYFSHVYASAMKAPLPKYVSGQYPQYKTIPEYQVAWNGSGVHATYLKNHNDFNYDNAFFQSLGENGRSCSSCHEPQSGMSVSVDSIRARYWATNGQDPVFAPVDGSNCPNQVSENNVTPSPYGGFQNYWNKSFDDSHSLLLNKGLFRIFLPMPDNAEFKIEVVSDPTTCNTDSEYNQVTDSNGISKRIISVYRRPVMSANLNFKLDTLFPAADGNSGNIMWDGREPTLRSQAISATLGHAQAKQVPTDEQLDEIVAFETSVFTAQNYDYTAGWLFSNGAAGGVKALADADSGVLDIAAPFDEFTNWSGSWNWMQSSIARGQNIFNTRAFTVSNVGGFNDSPLVENNAVSGSCGTCHNIKNGGTDALPNGQRDIGIGGQSVVFGGPTPATDLPIFKLTCIGGVLHPFHNKTPILTNDPGRALITGKCADIGAKTVPGLRALASRAPYFSDGSAADLWNVVDVYNNRFDIGLSYQEKYDLVSFMKSL